MVNKSWVVINYNLLNETRLIDNLDNQNFRYYFPKIYIKKNRQLLLLDLFPGYAFVQYEEKKIHSLNFTRGLNYVLKTGVKYPLLDNSYIDEIKGVQASSIKSPVSLEPELHSNATLNEGPLKGRVIKIIGFKSKDRITFMYNLLGRDLISDIEIKNIKF